MQQINELIISGITSHPAETLRTFLPAKKGFL